MQTAADMGMDIIDGANSVDASVVPFGGWKYAVCLAETVVASFTDNGGTPSTGFVGVTLSAGSMIAANGLFTAFALTSGTVAMIRG